MECAGKVFRIQSTKGRICASEVNTDHMVQIACALTWVPCGPQIRILFLVSQVCFPPPLVPARTSLPVCWTSHAYFFTLAVFSFYVEFNLSIRLFLVQWFTYMHCPFVLHLLVQYNTVLFSSLLITRKGNGNVVSKFCDNICVQVLSYKS